MALKGGSIDYIPDHPHEGECIIPKKLNTEFTLNGSSIEEWPKEEGRKERVIPEVVAKSMSHGDGFGSKAPLFPREFIAICAYDGQRAGVGRVVTDATWHHFIDININGVGAENEGLMPSGIDTNEMVLIRQHWINMANWLMPKTKRQCLFPIIVAHEFELFPLIEEFVVPIEDKRNLKLAIKVGEQLTHAMSNRLLPFQIEALSKDALALSRENITLTQKLKGIDSKLYDITLEQLSKAALGTKTLELFDMIHNQKIEKLNNEKELLTILEKAAEKGVRNNAKVMQEKLNSSLEILLKLSY